MLRVCMMCHEIIGCYHEGNKHGCDYCDLPCLFQKKIDMDRIKVSHGMCESCFRNRSKLLSGIPVS